MQLQGLQLGIDHKCQNTNATEYHSATKCTTLPQNDTACTKGHTATESYSRATKCHSMPQCHNHNATKGHTATEIFIHDLSKMTPQIGSRSHPSEIVENSQTPEKKWSIKRCVYWMDGPKSATSSIFATIIHINIP